MANLKNLLVTGTGRFTDKVYASEFVGTITRALADGDGNTFQSTYSKATGLVNSINNNSYPAVRMISATAESDDYKMGSSAFAVGTGTKASGSRSHASGSGVVASGDCAHAEGYYSEAKGDYSHAEGFYAKATGNGGCHAEGNNTEATGWCTHAEGSSTKATMNYAHAEGNGSVASGYISHAEGNSSVASGYISHAEGNGCQATHDNSHAEGQYTIARGSTSHAEGTRTIAGSTDQHVQGRYNIEDTTSTYAHIVGNGTGDTARSNAHTLDWNGNAWFQGNVYVGGTGMENATNSDKLVKYSEFDSAMGGVHNRITDLTISASKVYSGTFMGPVYADPNAQYLGPTATCLRNSRVTTDSSAPTVNGEISWIYE